ncbi:MAG: class I SAM-dependent methyltransferase [Candidatus Riflebacteria bacterium]|nr:class I SAM-dependent methyltransferase [Candidatus Riflebacteria bacterium]
MKHEDNAGAYDTGMKLHWLGSYNAFRRSIVNNFGDFKNSTILDFGCGTGLLLEFIKTNYQYNGLYLGIDPGAGMLKIANGKTIDHQGKCFVQIPLFPNFPVKSESVDIFVSSLVTHQIPVEGKQVLFNEIFRVLKPGGKAVMAEFGKPSGIIGNLLALYTKKVWGRAIPEIGANAPANFDGIVPRLFESAGFSQFRVTDRWKGSIDVMTGVK